MPKAIVDTLDGLPEPLAAEYEAQEDGRFRLKVEGSDGFELENVAGLKSGLEKERARRLALTEAAAKFEGIDPEAAREALARVEELRSVDPAKQAEVLASEKIKGIEKQFAEQHSKAMTPVVAERDSLKAQLTTLLVDQAASAAINAARGSVDLLLPHVLKYAKVSEVEPGRFAVQVLNDEGNARIKDASGADFEIADLVAEMQENPKFQRAFEATGHTGAGRVPPSGQAGGAGFVNGSASGSKQDRAKHFAQKFGVPLS